MSQLQNSMSCVQRMEVIVKRKKSGGVRVDVNGEVELL